MPNLGSTDTPAAAQSLDLPSGYSPAFEEDSGDLVINDSNGNTALRWDDTNGQFQLAAPLDADGNDVTNVGTLDPDELLTIPNNSRIDLLGAELIAGFKERSDALGQNLPFTFSLPRSETYRVHILIVYNLFFDFSNVDITINIEGETYDYTEVTQSGTATVSGASDMDLLRGCDGAGLNTGHWVISNQEDGQRAALYGLGAVLISDAYLRETRDYGVPNSNPYDVTISSPQLEGADTSGNNRLMMLAVKEPNLTDLASARGEI
jgi:hypothetical protein